MRYADLALAWHAVFDVARVAGDDCVLVHDAASSFGLASAWAARSIGARVLATVAAGQSREALKALGVEGVASFETLDFVDDVRRTSADSGVDVV